MLENPAARQGAPTLKEMNAAGVDAVIVVSADGKVNATTLDWRRHVFIRRVSL
jgi:hypothetical protein